MKKKNPKPVPPLILAIETATMCGSVALMSGELCLAENSVDTSTTHSRRLIRQVDQVMKDTGTEWDLLEGIAVSLGPGSFTGLRIGLSTAKGLAMAAGLPLLGVSTLDGLARQIIASPGTRVCALLDARKKEVYGAFYTCDDSGIPVKTGDDLVMKPEKLAALIEGPVIMIGDGGVAYRDLFREHLGDSVIFAPIRNFFPRAATIGVLASEKHMAGDFIDPADAVPIYVRPSEAELTVKKTPRPDPAGAKSYKKSVSF